MTLFRDTDAAAEFIATADSRNTSPEVMRAIAYYATDAAEAVALWDGGYWNGNDIEPIIWHATDNGRLHGADLHWGDRTLDQIMADEDAS